MPKYTRIDNTSPMGRSRPAKTRGGFTQPLMKKLGDLRNKIQVDAYFQQSEPEYVIIAAAKVGGIGANSKYPAEFIYDNLMIQTNIIDAAYRYGVKKLLFLG